MNIFWLLRGGGPFFGKWQVVVEIFWLVVGGSGWWWIYFGWWWVMVDGGIVQPNPSKNVKKRNFAITDFMFFNKSLFFK